MKKRSFITLLAVVFCVTLAAGIAACRFGGSGGSGNTHTHRYSDEWSCDAEYHWHDPVCYHSADEEVPVADKAPHEYEDGVCKVCKYIDDLLIVPQSRKLIEDKIAPVLFADRDEKTILSQNWQLITDNKNEYLTGLAATYIYATEEHTHVVNIDTISFTEFSLENLVGAKFSEFDKDSIKTENKKSLTASLIKTWEVNADEQLKAEALKNLSVADGYENTVRTLFADADGKNFLLECNAGTTRINSSSYADTKIEGRQVTELEYTVREHKYTTDNLCAATDCGYDGLEYKEIEGGYAITGTGELDKSKLKILNLSPTHKDRTVKKIGNDAFSGCTNLETVRIIGNNNAYIEEIGSRAFEGCERLYDFAWRKSLTSIGYDAFKDCVSLYRVQLEGTPQIGSGAFSGCKKIIEVYCMYDDLTEGSSSYGGIASYAKHVYGPNIEGHKSDSSRVWKSVNGDSEPFAGATFIFYNNKQENYLLGLDGGSFNFTTTDKLTLPKKLAYLGYSTEKYEVYDYAFAHFDEIKSVEIPESATAVASTAFDGCDNLESIETAEENTAYASQDGILYNKNKTQIIFVPKAIKGAVIIPNGITSIGDRAFEKRTGLTSITIPDSVSSIGDNAFEDCSDLESITIGNGVTSIGKFAFYNTAYYNNTANWITNVLYIDNCLISAKNTLSGNYEIEEGTKLIADYAFRNIESLTSITIPDSVTSIGSDAFNGCTSLTSITVSNNNTVYASQDGILYNKNKTQINFVPKAIKGAVTIPNGVTSIGNAFDGCDNLESIETAEENTAYASQDGILYNKNKTQIIFVPKAIKGAVTIPNGVTSIGQYAFYCCRSLESITIPDSVTSIGYHSFNGCTAEIKWGDNPTIKAIGESFYGYNGTSITIPDSVTSIGQYAFYYCRSLESITIPDSVTSIGTGAFEDCIHIKTATMPAWVIGYIPKDNLQSVTITSGNIRSSAFSSCTSLKSVTIGNSVTSIESNAFYECTAEIKWGDNPSIKEIGLYAFRGYKGTSITIPDSVTSIGQYAFEGCTNLESITIPESVTSIYHNAFEGCTNLESITVSYDNQTYSSQDGVLYNKDKTELIRVPQAKTSVTIPDSVESIGSSAFEGYTSLESITVSDDNQNFSGQDGVLYNKDKTKLIRVPQAKTSVTIPNDVTSIGSRAFEYCTSLESVTIPDSVTSIGSYAFYNTAYYNNLANWTDGVLYIGNCLIKAAGTLSGNYEIKAGTKVIADSAFQRYENLESITIPNSVTSIGNGAFWGCTAEIIWGDNPSIKEIGERAFEGYEGTSITIPNSVTSIGNKAFYECTSLLSVTIGNGVTSIGNGAFWGCTNLTSITIPDSVTSIVCGAFVACKSLESVEFINPDGWYYTKDYSATSGTDIKSEDLQNPNTAAKYLKSTYNDYYWKRKS